jgi:CheY-like chemotaxis protein
MTFELDDLGPTILFVDDDEDLRAIGSVILGEFGYRVIQASGPEEAMKIVREPGRIDLLLTDLAMPRVNGIELADLAKRVRAGLKVLYTSAYVRTTAPPHALRHGPLLEKPWRLEQVQAVVEMLIGPGRNSALEGGQVRGR